jgi:hypothetical protein
MAEAEKVSGQAEETVLVAQVMVQLVSGERFELLPFEGVKDVKCRVCDLVKDWAKSGFLVRGNEIIPWHQVQKVMAERVEELSKGESDLLRREWEARELERQQKSFWRTKNARKQSDDSGSGGGEPPRMAA